MNINPIDTYTVPVDASGVLSTLVKQPYDNSPSEDASGLHYTEKFKGPYVKTKEVLSHINVGLLITTVHLELSSYIGLSEQITYPACPTRNDVQGQWVLESVRVEEIDAGAHCHIYLEYGATINDGEEPLLEPDPWQDTWSLTWQTYSVDPYAFCSNTPNEPYPCSPTLEKEPQGAIPQLPSWNSSAMRLHIDTYLNSLPESIKVGGKTYYYYTPNQSEMDYRLFLNDIEAEVMKKKQLGRSATYHYPVLTHTTVHRGAVTIAEYSDTVGGDIDHTLDNGLPQGCPYVFPANTWTWLKIGDDMTQVKTRATNSVTFTRRQVYAGYTSVDKNFYGNGVFSHTEAGILSGRWEVEKL